jgi:tetratricopeptide (TPR) repeat protein
MRRFISLAIFLTAAVVMFFFTSKTVMPPAPLPSVRLPAQNQAAATAATYVGGQACFTCHATQTKLWTGSHHDRAMELPSDKSMLGNFADATIQAQGATTSFHKKDNKWMVRTVGADGKLADYQVDYTFGVHPLQQYLLAYQDGRKQAFTLAWDARPAAMGGQRWFDLLEGISTPIGHPYHWTGGFYTWNRTCAECHSTNVERGYDRLTNSYKTTFSDIDVSCEACHGPGSQHVAWATVQGMPVAPKEKGLVHTIKGARLTDWVMDPGTGIAKSASASRNKQEIDACAPCHARRSSLGVTFTPGQEFLDHYSPNLLEDDLYYADGQINDEVFEYGSFVQSKMHKAGVTCSDCHEPHSGKTYATDNNLCARCHMPSKFDTPAHHFHQVGGKGASCVDCHMPHNTYMTVHDRRDHSIKIPRPDVAAQIGAPDACSKCHQKIDKTQDAAWATVAWKKWWGEPKPLPAVEAIAAGRQRKMGALAQLKAVLADNAHSGMVRGSVASLIARQTGATAADLLSAAKDKDGLVRLGVAERLGELPASEQIQLASVLLRDSLRSVRIAAVRQLGASAEQLSDADKAQWKIAWSEAVAAAVSNADRPESLLDLGNLRIAANDVSGAENAWHEALKREPTYQPARMNLADVARQRGDETTAQKLLADAILQEPNNAAAHHALGLSLVRSKRHQEALKSLKEAVRLDPNDARFTLVYTVALHDLGSPAEALRLLEDAVKTHPTNVDLISTLINFLRAHGRGSDALPYVKQLQQLLPNDQSVR